MANKTPSKKSNASKPAGRKPSATPPNENLVASQNEALEVQIEGLRKRLADRGERGASDTYAMASIVRAIMEDGAQYGGKAVEKAAKKLGVSAKSLYRWAEVARTWPTMELISPLLVRRGKDGFSLSWSHLELLADKAAAERRGVLIEAAFRESLSVRALRVRICGPKSASGKAQEKTEQASTPTGRFEQLLQDLGLAATTASGWKDVVKELASQPYSPEVVDSLDRARDVAKRLQTLASEMESMTEAELKRLRPPTRKPRSRSVASVAPTMNAAP